MIFHWGDPLVVGETFQPIKKNLALEGGPDHKLSMWSLVLTFFLQMDSSQISVSGCFSKNLNI